MDNTASPVICKPIEHGAAVVIHSLTKFIGGHGTVIGGCLVDGGNFDWTGDPKRQPLFNEPDPSYGGAVSRPCIIPQALSGAKGAPKSLSKHTLALTAKDTFAPVN